jgi:hypothetical protein
MKLMENAMNTSTSQLELMLVRPSPWTSARAKATPATRMAWRHVVRDLCLLLALVSSGVAFVALRLSLYVALLLVARDRLEDSPPK